MIMYTNGYEMFMVPNRMIGVEDGTGSRGPPNKPDKSSEHWPVQKHCRTADRNVEDRLR